MDLSTNVLCVEHLRGCVIIISINTIYKYVINFIKVAIKLCNLEMIIPKSTIWETY
jgi:hypothetical protein